MDRLVGALWPSEVAGNFLIWTNPDHTSYHIPLETVRSLTESDLDDLRQENTTQCIYFGLGLRRPGLPTTERGGKRDVVALPGFALDIDVLDPAAHKALNLPQTDDDVLAILEPFPAPTAVVATGHGYHCYWCFSEPLGLGSWGDRQEAGRAFAAFQAPFVTRAKELGFHVDKTDTIDRVWRLPGFQNVKAEPHKPVVLNEVGEDRYTAAELGFRAVRRRQLSDDSSSQQRQAVDTALSRSGSNHTGSADVPSRKPISLTRLKAILTNLTDPDHHALFERVLAGESFAERGERDSSMQRVCSVLVYAAKGCGEPEALAELLRPSLNVWAGEPDADKTVDDEVAKAIDKIRRAQENWDEREAHKEAQRQRDLDALGRRFLGQDYQPGTLTEQHLIIQFRRSYFVHHFGLECYVGPHIKEELLTVVRDAFDGTEFETTYLNAKGEVKQKQPATLMDQYGTVARHLQGSFAIQESYYDPVESVFHYATTPMRNLTPKYNAQIEEWLRILGGDDADVVLDWVAGIPQLTRQCAALALIGDPGTGKSTLALGLARLWHEAGPTRWELSVGANFNESLIQCPLIELSEGIDNPKGASSAFRALTGTQELVINPKGLSPYSVIGCVRILITSNDDQVLNDITGTRELTNASVHAVAERLIYVKAVADAATFLESLKRKDPHTIDRWVQNSLIARYALWLRDNRQLSPSSRFLVKGKITPMHQRLVAKKKDSESLLEWICGYMTNPSIFERNFRTKKKEPYTTLGEGVLLLNGPEIQETWDLYTHETTEKLSVTKIGTLLGNLADSRKKKLNRGGARVWAYEIDAGVVFTFAQANMLGDLDAMSKHLHRKEKEAAA
jgi:hypothetical protein